MAISLPFLKNRVSTAERAFLSRQLATMLQSGLPLDRAVGIVASQTENQFLGQILKQIQTDLEAGLPFSTAIAKHPKVFSRVYVNVAIAGEAVGKLAEVLNEMAGRLEEENEFSSKVKGALYYPAFIFVAMIAIGVVVMVTVIPQLKDVFFNANVQLPITTRILIGLSDFLAHSWWVALIVLVLLIVGLRAYLKTEQGKEAIDLFMIRMPTGMGKNLYMVRFSRTLSLLIQSGTPIIEALSITGEVINNSLYKDVIDGARDEVARGIPLSVPISKSKFFPVIVSQMISVGEQTGRLDEVLSGLADYYEGETNTQLKALSSLFEPVMIVIMGLGVAFIVLSIFVPIYQIAQFQ